jgi:hypothetical protein
MKLFEVMDTSFDKFDQTVRRYLQKTFNNLGIEYTHHQIFEMIFEGVKGIMQNMMFYIEDALTEQNIYTAVRKQSVYSLAKLSGYEPYYGSAACGTIIGKIQINNGLASKSSKIYIPNKAKLINLENGVLYSILLPTNYYIFDVSQPLINHEFKIVQGVFKRATSIANGYNLETIHISTTELFDRQYVEVKVNGETWTEVGNLYDMTENGHEYMLQIGYDNSFDIMFGNDIYGLKLTKGDTITVDYLTHDGVLGNILTSEHAEFSFNNYGLDTLNNEVNINDYMTLSIKNCISGGSNSDTIDFIKTMIGSNSRSLVLVSENNFNLFFKRFSFVGYTSCWSESNTMLINATCLTNVKSKIKDIEDYFTMNIDDMLLTYDQKNMIINTLENSKKSFAGLTLNFVDPVIRQFAFICYVKIDNIYNKDTAIQSIRNILGEYFLNIENNTLFIAKSELISLISSKVDCILSIDLDIISEYGESAYHDNSYIKYELKNTNNTYSYIKVEEIYENSIYPGLDGYGNISLNSKLEVPVLHGGFTYYPNKSENDKTESFKIPDIQVYFI